MEDFENRVIELKSYLTKRGFKSGEVDNQLQRARRLIEVADLHGIWGVVIRKNE